MKELIVVLAAIRSSYYCIIGGLLLIPSVCYIVAMVNRPKKRAIAIILGAIGILVGILFILYGLALF